MSRSLLKSLGGGLLAVLWLDCAPITQAQSTSVNKISDVVTVPTYFESAIRTKFPSAVVEPANCNSLRTATSCDVAFVWVTALSRRASGGCMLLFYGGSTDAVFESVSCVVVGPPDGSITAAERANVFSVRNALLEIAIARTVPSLSLDERRAFVAGIKDGEKQLLQEKGWDIRVSNANATHIMELFAKRTYNAVTDEHARRFGKR